MKLLAISGAILASSHYVSAASCVPGGLLGLGSVSTLDDTFVLKARAPNGTELLLVNDPQPIASGFFFTLRLGAPDASVDDANTPTFQLQLSTAYATGGTSLATNGDPLLAPGTLYLGADSGQQSAKVTAINATCDGKVQQILKFSALGPVSTTGASYTNGSFAPGSTIVSPILDNLVGLGPLVDLIIVPHNSTD